MGRFESRWTEQQREAIERAHCDKGHTFAAITRAAHQGELPHEGAELDPFEIPYATVREIATREAKRRAGKAHSALVSKPAATANEEIRRRLVSILDHETLRIERAQEKSPKSAVNAEQVRKLARALFELERLSTVKAPRVDPLKPATRRNPGGMGGRVLAAVAPGAIAEPATDDPDRDRRINVGDGSAMAENGAPTDAIKPTPMEDDDAAPVDYARDRLSRLTASVS